MLYPTPCAARSFARADRVSADGFRRRARLRPRLGSQTSDRVPGTRGARGPATNFSSLGAREIGRGSVGAGFPDSRRRPRADVVARTSSSSSSSRGASRQWKTRARRERDANRREPTTVRAAAIERRGATEARARRFAFDLESRRSFASTREFRRVEGANADDARARDVG